MRAFGLLGAHMQRTLLSSQFRQVRCIVSKSEQLSAIKALREQSGAPISDVKSALVDADWHPDGAMDVLRKKGLAAAGKKASRSAAQGLIGFARDDDSAVLVELNSETDFVSRNEQFTSLLSQIAQAALRQTPKDSSGELDVETLRSAPASEGSTQSVGGALSDLVGTVRENMQLRRAYRLSAENGVVSVYLHAGPAPGFGRMGALLALESSGPPLEGDARSSVEELGRHLAMHAVAMKPPYLDRTSVPEAALEAERVLLREQALESGKQPKVIDRIVEGRLAKFYEDQCLLDQKFVMSDKQSVQETLQELSKKLGVELRVSGFVRLQCGEGMVTQQTDFASEVAAMAA